MPNQKTSGYAAVNGLKMYYEIYGEGPMPLVLIHGGGSTIESTFGNMIPQLARHYRLVAVELQAHGRTSDRNAPESFEQDADDVAALLAHLRIDRADILGFSNGGTTTLQLAIRHSAMVHKMIVISGCYQREGLLAGIFDGLKDATLDHMPEPLKVAFLKVNSDVARLQVMFDKDKERMLNFKDMADDDLRSINLPTLFIGADKDVVTAEHVVKMAKLVPGARMAILPGNHSTIIGETGVTAEEAKLSAITVSIAAAFLNE